MSSTFLFLFFVVFVSQQRFIYYHKSFLLVKYFFIFLFQTFFELVCSLERSIRISSSTETVNRFFHFFLFFCNFILFRRFFTSCYRQPLRLFFRQTACVLGERNDLLNCIYLFSFFYKSCIASVSYTHLDVYKRQTQSRSALLWKPWIFGLEDSHLYLATHSGILSSMRCV